MYTTSANTHDRLVKALVDKFGKEGWTVQADGIGHPNGSPDPIDGFVPDMIAWKHGETPIIAEAENCDSIYSEHTRKQWTAFAKVIGYKFHVIIPKSCFASAQQQATEWGIRVDYWWHLDV